MHRSTRDETLMTGRFGQGTGRVAARRLTQVAGSLALAASLAACASGGPGEPMNPTPSPPLPARRVGIPWACSGRGRRVSTSISGAWLCDVMTDTTKVRYFRRGYRDEMVVIKTSRAHVALDTKRETLARRFSTHPQLNRHAVPCTLLRAVQDLREVITLFLQLEGDVPARRRARVRMSAAGSNIPEPGRPRLAAMFTESLEDENAKFYHGFWSAAAQSLPGPHSRRLALAADGIGHSSAYLNNTQQATGDFLLSLPLNGEKGARSPSAASTSLLAPSRSGK